MKTATQPVSAELNGLRISIDSESGGLLSLEYDGVTMLRRAPGSASLLDAAYPGYGFEPLRLGTRYSKGARVTKTDGAVEIAWDALGMSRDFKPKGSVSATVRMRAAEDGRSIILTASIKNESEIAIPQVLFPDFEGLLPFSGKDQTELHTCGCVMKPFVELELPEDDGWWYAGRKNWTELKWGAYDKTMSARWLDLGSLSGGISLFPKVWSWGELTTSGTAATERVLLHLSQLDGALRLMCEHQVTIAPGGAWTSPEYVLTPHRHGWAKGIEPFRAWIQENVRRPHPLPSHLRQSLGFRTVWLAQQYVKADPAGSSVVWRFSDLPGLAKECRDHGLCELVLWVWQPWEIPDQPSPELGTLEEFEQALAECRALGVNVSLFISVMTMLNPLPEKYGLNDNKEDWGYHTDLVPMLRPYYGKASRGSFAVQSHPGWQNDITKSLLRMVERGWTSICWDQAMHASAEPNLETVFAAVRAAASAKDPDATFSGENLNNIDLDSRWLDYTWDWALFVDSLDWRALVNAYATPRFNVNVGNSPKVVKRLFVDHLFMNILPSKPEGVNGSARIVEYPELSRALKTCAALHAKFRPYLEEGLLVGDCVLAKPCDEARINGYVHGSRVLILVLNTSADARSIRFGCDMTPWIEGASNGCRIIPYDETGAARPARVESRGVWTETTGVLAPNEIALYEISAQR
ncbi:MAG: hypothetical protein HZB26_03690 [Candidatus Hydrogenedentes bacterium]|nr:hypothetical protein [Candidatus Hydrogenedentota bacterium]